MSALGKQVGGNHYVSMKVQPIEFAMRNEWDACAFSALKYISRHRAKNGAIDIQKAIHFIDIRLQLGPKRPVVAVFDRMTMSDYIWANGFVGADAASLRYLEAWVIHSQDTALKNLRNFLSDILVSYGLTAKGS